jgi:hypothetical protein
VEQDEASTHWGDVEKKKLRKNSKMTTVGKTTESTSSRGMGS